MKINDDQLEPNVEESEQRLMHEYATDVVNQLVLPVHSCKYRILASRFICFMIIFSREIASPAILAMLKYVHSCAFIAWAPLSLKHATIFNIICQECYLFVLDVI